MLDPIVLQEVSLACKNTRCKTQLKRGKPFCGKSVKEIIAAAGKRQLTHEDEIQLPEDEDTPLPLNFGRPSPRKRTHRLSLDRRSSVEGFLLSQENLLDKTKNSPLFVNADSGRIPLSPSKRRRNMKLGSLAFSSIDLLGSTQNNGNNSPTSPNSRLSYFSPRKISTSNSSKRISLGSPTGSFHSPNASSGRFDLSNVHLDFNNVDNNAQEDGGGLLSLGATKGTELSATEIQFNLGKDLGRRSSTETEDNYPAFLSGDNNNSEDNSASDNFRDDDEDYIEKKKQKKKAPSNIFETAEGRELFQGSILERGVFSDDSDDEPEPKRKPVLSRFMIEPDDYDPEREERRALHHEKFMADTLSRKSRFGKYIKAMKNNTAFYSQSSTLSQVKGSSPYTSPTYKKSPQSPYGNQTTLDQSSLYASPKSNKYSNKYLDDYDENEGTTTKRRHKHHHYGDSVSRVTHKKNHKFLSGDF